MMTRFKNLKSRRKDKTKSWLEYMESNAKPENNLTIDCVEAQGENIDVQGRRSSVDSSNVVQSRRSSVESSNDVRSRRPSGDEGYKDWEDISNKRKNQLTAEVYDSIISLARAKKTSFHEIVTHLIQVHKRKVFGHGAEKPTNEDTLPGGQLSPVTSQAIVCESYIGRTTFQSIKKIMIAEDQDVFCSWKKMYEFRKEISPEMKMIYEDPVGGGDEEEDELPVFCGVYYSFQEAVVKTTEQLMKVLKIDIDVARTLQLSCKYGFDGSGGHKIYQQQGNMNTENLILCMFCPLMLEDTATGEILWKQSAPNSDFAQRPLLLLLGKETHANIDHLRLLEPDRVLMEKEGIQVAQVCVKVKTIAHCLDRKAANLYTGVGGAYCDLCTYTKEACRSIELIEEGIPITRSVKDTKRIFDSLVDDDGQIMKKPGDADTRQGCTSEPITEIEAPTVQILHSLLRTFDHWARTCVHLNAGIRIWKKPSSSTQSKFLTLAKDKIQAKLKKIGIRWDFVDSNAQGGTSTTGNTVRRLLYDENGRKIFTEGISSAEDRAAAETYGHQLSIILGIVSSDGVYDIEKYRDYCTQLYVHLLTKLSWVSITPTLHKLLAHSAELMEANDCHGLKNISEEGLEANNKIVRKFRSNLSRKVDQKSNLSDCLARLWIGSDPEIVMVRLKGRPKCSNCQEVGHSKRYCPSACKPVPEML
eukprot:TRINITY_DN4153_c0_g1_i1.p1 TRINITY_DN4153_c0_g1~~TRINITY_DN4153_c0_g1_i1.p1  ORF type:complete len:755 (-),score=121.41 TRINITY_DN4153_c0_g1_i1:80-2179(-)